MDWLLDPRHSSTVDRAREAVLDHLRRHAADRRTVAEAEADITKNLRVVVESHDRPLWVHLDWSTTYPRLTVRALDVSRLRDNQLAALSGLSLVPAQRRAELAEAADETVVCLDLDVARMPVQELDPEKGVLADLDVDPLRDGAAAATVAMAAAAEAHPAGSPEQTAAVAGAVLADAAITGDPPATAAEAIEIFSRAHAALGSAPSIVSSEGDRIEIVIDRCPFGRAVKQAPSLCRITQAMAGRLAARANGEASVVLEESIAAGDPVCRLQVLLDPKEAGAVSNTYHWPPAGTTKVSHEAPPRLELAVSLPRESHSVPVVRRLSAQALHAFGVTADDIDDVELAITEACANVVEHATDSDTYEVNVELAADRCAITVIDRGYGFDAASIGSQDDDDAEGGRGLTLMRALVDNLDFTSEPMVGAVVHMVKALRYDRTHPLHRD